MIGWIRSPAFAGVAVAAGLMFAPAASAFDGLQGWKPIATAELSALRGGTEVEVTNNVNDVTVDADGMTASNSVAGGSFAHSMGIITNIQNNGHGAVINNAINVDVAITAAP